MSGARTGGPEGFIKGDVLIYTVYAFLLEIIKFTQFIWGLKS